MANETLEVAIGEDGGGSNKLIAAIERLTKGLDNLANSSDKTVKSVKAEGEAAKTAATGNDKLASSVDKAKTGFGGLGSALSGITALLSVSKLISYADQYAGISNKLKLVTTDQTKLNNIIEQAYGIAQRNSTGLEDTAKLYGQLSQVAKTLGKDQSEVAKMTETVTQAISLTAPSAEEAKNALTQFNQGLSAGVLRGDEFNSVMENAPGLARAIAAGFSSAGPITTGELRKMAEEGKLTGKAITEALERAGPNIAILARNSTDTVAKAFTRLENATLKFVGQTNEASGATALLAKGIDLITNNIGVAVVGMTAFVAVLALGALAGAVQSIIGIGSAFLGLVPAISAATAVMLANPLFLIATVATIGGVILALKATGLTMSEVGAKVAQYGGETGKAALAALGLSAAVTGTVAPALRSDGALEQQDHEPGKEGHRDPIVHSLHHVFLPEFRLGRYMRAPLTRWACHIRLLDVG